MRESQRTGAAPNISDAYTINGQPGDLYKCSTKGLINFLTFMITITTLNMHRKI